MYRVKVGDSLFPEASAPSKKAARQLAAEEAVKELISEGKLQLNKVGGELPRDPNSDQRAQGHFDQKTQCTIIMVTFVSTLQISVPLCSLCSTSLSCPWAPPAMVTPV